MKNVSVALSVPNALNDTHTARQAVLRLTTQLMSCPFAALVSLMPDGAFHETSHVGTAPANVLKPHLLRLLAEATTPVVFPSDSSDAAWSLAGVQIATIGHAETQTMEFLLVVSPPSDPLDIAYLAPLTDLAACMRPLLRETTLSSDRRTMNARRSRLPNRTAFGGHIQNLVSRAARETRVGNFGVIRVELDHLAQINERQGWDTADIIIDEMIERIESVLPENAYLSYFGGGSVGVATPLNTSLVNTRSLVNAIQQKTQDPVTLGTGPLGLSISIGWAMFPQDGDQAEDLTAGARAALAEVSRNGGGHNRRANQELLTRFRDASSLEQDLVQAITNECLSLNWMPIIEAGSQRVVALEALLRWNRPGHGTISPDLFIRCAEEAGIIEQLDAWSLRNACLAAQRWSSPLRLCVNISPVWLVNERLANLVASVLKETGLPPDRLQIELSERRPFGPRTLAHRELSRLRALGVRVALDDFGAGYSSLERLGTFPVDQIKLDRAFVRRLGDDSRVDDILRSILQLALTLGVTCCAKGVETEHQLAFLDAYGCEEIQGYLLGEPVAEYADAHGLTAMAE